MVAPMSRSGARTLFLPRKPILWHFQLLAMRAFGHSLWHQMGMSYADLRSQLIHFLLLSPPPSQVRFVTQARTRREGYDEIRIHFAAADGKEIPAFLLIPQSRPPVGGLLIQHQHASEWHWEKSEVAGLVGDPLQAFGPALARRGFVKH